MRVQEIMLSDRDLGSYRGKAIREGRRVQDLMIDSVVTAAIVRRPPAGQIWFAGFRTENTNNPADALGSDERALGSGGVTYRAPILAKSETRTSMSGTQRMTS